MNAMVEAVILFNPRGDVLRANPSSLDLFGIDPSGMTGSELVSLLAIRHPDGSPVLVEDLPALIALRGDPVTAQRLLLVDSEGKERVVTVSASMLYPEAGDAYAITVWHDVSERERLLEQLEVEQSRLETIIENAPDAILVMDEEGRLVMGNPAAERILGQGLPYGQDFTSFSALRFCHIDGTPYDPRNLPLTCSALDGEWIMDLEALIRRESEPDLRVMLSSAPIVDRKGNLNGAVGVIQDITGQKLAEETLRQQARRSHLLAALSRIFAEAGLNYSDLLNTIVDQISQVFGDFSSLHLFDEDGQVYTASAENLPSLPHLDTLRQAIQDLSLPAGQGLGWEVLQSGQPLLLLDYSPQQFFEALAPGRPVLPRAALPGVLNAMLIPLRAYGRPVGILNIVRAGPDRGFQDEEQVFLQDLADRAALAVEDAHLYEQEARRAREFHSLNQAATLLLSTLDPDTMMGQILKSGAGILPFAKTAILFLEGKDTGQMQLLAMSGPGYSPTITTFLAGQAGRAVEKRDSIILDPLPSAPDPPSEETLSALVVPLIAPEDIRGALVLLARQPHKFNSHDRRLLDSFAATAAVALHNAYLHAEVQRLATTDTLTGQYNRRKFFELGELEMHRFQRFRTPLSAIMFDLDTFKEINDTYGHAAGDAVLRCVAQRARASIRVIDILGRYGGDEFSILLPNAGITEAYEIAERIRQAIAEQPVKIPGGELPVAISLGVAEASKGTDSLSSLLGRADTALYSAKQTGRNRIVLG